MAAGCSSTGADYGAKWLRASVGYWVSGPALQHLEQDVDVLEVLICRLLLLCARLKLVNL